MASQFDDIIAELNPAWRWSLSDLYPDEYEEWDGMDFDSDNQDYYDNFEDYLTGFRRVDPYEIADAKDILDKHNETLR